MTGNDEYSVYMLALHGRYSARGICKLLKKKLNIEVSTSVIYRILHEHKVRLRDERNAETDMSVSEGLKIMRTKPRNLKITPASRSAAKRAG